MSSRGKRFHAALGRARAPDFQFVIWRFDPSRPSKPVLRLALVCNLRLSGPEIPAFRAFDFISKLPISQSRGRNQRKSPA
jgi:hypothetical protein